MSTPVCVTSLTLVIPNPTLILERKYFMNTNNSTIPVIADYFPTATQNPAKSCSYIKNLVKLKPVLAEPCGQHGNPSLISQLLALPEDTLISSLELDNILGTRHRHIVSNIEHTKGQLNRYGKLRSKIINVPEHRDSYGVLIPAKEQTIYLLTPEMVLHLFLNLEPTDETLAINFSIVRELFQI